MTWLLAAGVTILVVALMAGVWLWRRRTRQRAKGEAWSRQDKIAVAGAVITALLGAATLALGVVSFMVQTTTGRAAAERAASTDLRIASVSVLDPTESRDAPTIDLKLRNVGGQVSVLTGVAIVVRSSGRLVDCQDDEFSAEYLEASGTYPVALPGRAAPGTTITAPISQSMAPNSADEFQITVGVQGYRSHLGRISRTYWVYVVDLAVFHDGASRPVPAGSAVLFVPEAHNQASATDYSEFITDYRDGARTGRNCYAKNRALVQRMQAEPGAKPPSLLNTSLIG